MKRIATVAASALALAAPAVAATDPSPGYSALAPVAAIDERFQSYNVEMVEVTGGRFWAPYGGPPGEVYRMRPPTDLADPKLRALARHLGPAYLRVSGTWANSTYLEARGERLAKPPPGFNQLLTRGQWRGVVAFAKSADARIVTSFPASPGARGSDGSWDPEQAQRLVELTREAGGSIYGAELFNEPTMPQHGAFPAGYSAADYGRDFRIFAAWARKAAPEMKLTGPGGTAEGTMLKHGSGGGPGGLSSDELMQQNPGSLDIVSYHHYGAVSLRCGKMPLGAADMALSAEWLAQTGLDFAHYASLRDRYEAGKPLWLNETAQAACGGSPWASTFRDSFRYLNQLGVLAQKGVAVVAHNTLAASDYGLIDRDTLVPRPNYWAAVLWRRTMGTTVLAAPQSPSPDLRLYAHCLRGVPGGVGLLALNTGAAAQSLGVGRRALGWTMTGQPLDTRAVTINRRVPGLGAKGNLTGLAGLPVRGRLAIPGQSIAFVAVRDANNPACR